MWIATTCGIWDTPRPMPHDFSLDSLEAIAARLALLRKAKGASSAAEFARRLDIGATAWNNYETATRRISLDEAMKVVRLTGASLDWIYRGLEWTLPAQLLEEINEARAADDADEPKRRGRRRAAS